jgi:hypothetical protein
MDHPGPCFEAAVQRMNMVSVLHPSNSSASLVNE